MCLTFLSFASNNLNFASNFWHSGFRVKHFGFCVEHIEICLVHAPYRAGAAWPMPRTGPGRPAHAPPHVRGPWGLRPRGPGGGRPQRPLREGPAHGRPSSTRCALNKLCFLVDVSYVFVTDLVHWVGFGPAMAFIKHMFLCRFRHCSTFHMF